MAELYGWWSDSWTDTISDKTATRCQDFARGLEGLGAHTTFWDTQRFNNWTSSIYRPIHLDKSTAMAPSTKTGMR